MSYCAIPKCNEPAVEPLALCQKCLDAGLLGDYEQYCDLLDDGMRPHAAAVQAGLVDPDS